MGKAQPVIDMRLHSGLVRIAGMGSDPVSATLPEGCIGICFVFESKTAARKWDKNANLLEIERSIDNLEEVT